MASRAFIKPLTPKQRKKLDRAATHFTKGVALLGGVAADDVDRLMKEVLRGQIKQVMGTVIFLTQAAMLEEGQ